MDYEVAIIGGGPAGSSAGYWLAQAGHKVAIFEKKAFPRQKTCGDGLTPRATYWLRQMGLEQDLHKYHFYKGLRSYGFGRCLEMEWPDHPLYGNIGYTVTRYDLDQMVANHAEKAGATLFTSTEATKVDISRDGLEVYAHSKSQGDFKGSASQGDFKVSARYLLVCEGANSRIGRSLGVTRNRQWPQGMAIRSYWESPRHDEPWIESHLDIRDSNHTLLPGYGWIFPLGDGRVNIGVGLLDNKTNTSKLLDAFLEKIAESWQIDINAPCIAPTGGRLPMGFSLSPISGHNFLIAGDSAGTINPFNGEGIAYAYETGALAAKCLGNALDGGGAASLARYEEELNNNLGRYYKVGRLFVRAIGQPIVLHTCVSIGMRSKPIMKQVMKVMADLM